MRIRWAPKVFPPHRIAKTELTASLGFWRRGSGVARRLHAEVSLGYIMVGLAIVDRDDWVTGDDLRMCQAEMGLGTPLLGVANAELGA